MRVLDKHEMDAVAGGLASTPAMNAETVTRSTVKIKLKSGIAAPMEEMPIDGDGDDGGGGGGGDYGGGGGDYGGGGDTGGDYGGGGTDDTGMTGGDDGYGNVMPDINRPVDDAQNSMELAMAEANPKVDIGMTCNTENGSKTCISGNGEHFIVTQTDRYGSTTAYSCSLNAGFSISLTVDLFKAIAGGSGSLSFTSSPSFTCAPVPKHG